MIYGKLPTVFLSVLAGEKHGSTNSVIAAYILEHLEEVQHLGIKELAQCCNVGTASVSRFCKDIGLSDFAELRELLAENQMYFERSSEREDINGRIQEYAYKIADSIQRSAVSVNVKRLQELCEDIQRYKNIAVFGLLKAESAAISLQGDLLMLGKKVYTNISYSQQFAYISEAGEDDLVIVFSYTGAYFDYPEKSLLIEKKHWPRIWMISGKKRVYPPFVKRVLHFSSLHNQTGHPYQLLFIASLIAQEYARIL